MKRYAVILFGVFFVVAFGCVMLYAQCGDGESSLDSGDSEGWGETKEMDSEMDVQPGESTDALEEKGMDVQPGDSIDSEGTGAH